LAEKLLVKNSSILKSCSDPAISYSLNNNISYVLNNIENTIDTFYNCKVKELPNYLFLTKDTCLKDLETDDQRNHVYYLWDICSICRNYYDYSCSTCEKYFCSDCRLSTIEEINCGNFLNCNCTPHYKRYCSNCLPEYVVLKNEMKKRRRINLSVSLNKLGLVLRRDSHLCAKYISHGSDDPNEINSICQRLCQMNFLFEYCNCRQICNEIYHERHYYDNILEEAERRILLTTAYPEVWPWAI
jgi:hypothetical protein